MSRFFVGQRVRINWSEGWPELAGGEGRVEGAARVNVGLYVGSDSWRVAPDAWGRSRAPRMGDNGATVFTPIAGQIEPILPDGHRAGDYSNVRDLMDSLRSGVSA